MKKNGFLNDNVLSNVSLTQQCQKMTKCSKSQRIQRQKSLHAPKSWPTLTLFFCLSFSFICSPLPFISAGTCPDGKSGG